METKIPGSRRRGMLALLAALMAAIALSVAPAAAYAEDAGVAVWRLYNQWSGEHLFTTDKGEYDSLQGLGWSGEGKAWDAPSEGDEVFRLYNPYSGDHHYTMDKDEYGHLGEIGWRQEGVVFHSADASSGTPIYRLFNRWLTQGTHLFTTDKGEYDNLGQIGWQQEGIAFYAMGGPGGPYTVRFVSWDDSQGKEVTVSEQVLAAGERISIPDAPVRTDKDYEFRGWDGVYDGMRCSGSFTSRALWAPTTPEEIEAPAGTVVEELSFAPDVMCGEGEVEYLDDGELPSWLAGAAGAEGISAASSGAGVCAKVRASDTLGLLPGRGYIVNRGDFLNGAAMIVEDVRECPGSPLYRIVVGRVPAQLTDVVDSLELDGRASYDLEKDIDAERAADGSPVTLSFSKDGDGRLGLGASVDLGRLGKGGDGDLEDLTGSFRRLAKLLDGTHAKEETGGGDASGEISVDIKAAPRFSFRLEKGKVPIQTLVFDDLDATVTAKGRAKGDIVEHVGYFRIGLVFVDVDVKMGCSGSFDVVMGVEGARLGYDQTGRYPNSLGSQNATAGKLSFEATAGVYADAMVCLYGIVSADASIGDAVKAEASLASHPDPELTCIDLKLEPSFPVKVKAVLWDRTWSDSLDLADGLKGDSLRAQWHFEDDGSGPAEVSGCTWGSKAVFKDDAGKVVKVVEHSAGDRLLDGAPELTKKGHVLIGWKKEGSKSKEPIASDAAFSKRTVLIPVWEEGSSFGDGCTWTLGDDGTLTVRPADGKSGTMAPLSKAVYDWRSVKKVVISKGVKAPEDSSSLFAGISLATIDASNLDTSQVKSMRGMFHDCTSLKDLTFLSDWNISQVTDMSGMFKGCSSLADLSPLSSWDVSKVTDMGYWDEGINWGGMFSDCKSLSNLSPLSSWDVCSVTDMSYMFYGCGLLANLAPLSNWKVFNLIDMSRMFYGCPLKDLSPLSSWDVSKVTSMWELFSGCSSLADLSPLSSWDVSQVTDMGGMFSGCTSLTDLSPLSDWKTQSVTHMEGMFSGCTSLTDLSPLSDWKTQSVTYMDRMFSGCTSLTDLSPLSSWNVSNVTGMSYIFSGCASLKDLSGLSSWDVSQVTDMAAMFYGCKSLADLAPLSKWVVSRVTSMGGGESGDAIYGRGMFYGCTSLTDLAPLSSWDVSSVMDMRCMFRGCTSLTDLAPLSSWDVSSVMDMSCMFLGCTSLADLSPLSAWHVNPAVDTWGMFEYCSSLIDATKPSWC